MQEKETNNQDKPRWNGPKDGPFPLQDIQMALVCKAIEKRFFQPLKTFWREMVLEWGQTPTAHACRRKGVPTIVLGREFFAKNVLTTTEAAEIVMHEIMHHLFLHLTQDKIFRAQGYSHGVINVGEDAIINAYLHKIDCASFMARFYQDTSYYAFLRPGSKNVDVEPAPAAAREQEQEAGTDYSWAHGRTNFRADPGERFYCELMRLDITLEQSVEFFNKYFAKASGTQPLLGSHGSAADGDQPQQEAPSEGDAEESGNGDAGGQSIGEEPAQDSSNAGQSDEPLFGRGEAEGILRALEIGVASQRAQNNFKRIIATITQYANLPGNVRTSKTFTRRIPAKFGRYELISIERGRNLFRRWDYQTRKFALFLDVSGSTAAYIPFVLGLAKSLRGSEHSVRSFVWADEVAEISLDDLGKKDVAVGNGTQGEKVAAFLAANEISDAVIITDNAAGDLGTQIRCRVHLCLFPHSQMSGSFLNTAMVPHCKTHQLEVD